MTAHEWLTPTQRVEVVQMRRGGMRLKSIADHFGVKPQTVCNIARRTGKLGMTLRLRVPEEHLPRLQAEAAANNVDIQTWVQGILHDALNPDDKS